MLHRITVDDDDQETRRPAANCGTTLCKVKAVAGVTAGMLVVVLLTTALDHGGADAIAPRFRSLLDAALVISAVVAALAELADQSRSRENQLREKLIADLHDEIHDALADAYAAGAIMTAGTTPVLRSVARD